MVHAHQQRDAVAHDIAAGDADRIAVDVGRHHPVPQQFRRRDRQDAGPGPDIERMAKAMASRQPVERQEAAAGRLMLAGAECCRGVNQNPDRTGRDAAVMMRSADMEAADPLRWEGQLVFRQPVAVGEPLLPDLDERAASRRRGKSEPCGKRRRQQWSTRVGLDPPLARGAFEKRDGLDSFVKNREHRGRRMCAAHSADNPPDGARLDPHPAPLRASGAREQASIKSARHRRP